MATGCAIDILNAEVLTVLKVLAEVLTVVLNIIINFRPSGVS